MGYDTAINKAWEDLAGSGRQESYSVRFLGDEYSIDLKTREVLSLSCNIRAKDFTVVLILHYLIKRLSGLPELTGEWLPFRELSQIEGYYPAFRKRSIEPIIRKYGKNPEAIFETARTVPLRRAEGGDCAAIIEAFEGVPALVKIWHADEEFGPDANIFFDRSVTGIFCTEDIVVLAGFVGGSV